MRQALGHSSPTQKNAACFPHAHPPHGYINYLIKKLNCFANLAWLRALESTAAPPLQWYSAHSVSEEGGRHTKRLTRLSYTRLLKCLQHVVFNMLRCGFTLDEGLHGGD